MLTAFVVVIGLVAGFHAALYGAYKDSPHESFLLRRFVRELVFATSVATVIAVFNLNDGQGPFIFGMLAAIPGFAFRFLR